MRARGTRSMGSPARAQELPPEHSARARLRSRSLKANAF